MRERPILFSTPMVQAILEGRKFVTRRVLNRDKLYNGFAFDDPRIARACPYGQEGDRLWVRETWFQFIPPHLQEGAVLPSMKRVWYRADEDCPFDGCKWRPSIFMSRWASRITLEVVSVRVERLQDISEADAISEGVESNWLGPDPCPPEYQDEWMNYGSGDEDFPCFSAVDSFKSLWETINAKRGYSWESNPWVWVIEFKRIES